MNLDNPYEKTKIRTIVSLLKYNYMKALFELLGALLRFVISWGLTMSITFGMRLLIVVFSAIFGWVVGWFFGDTILGILAQMGIVGFSMWQIGAFLGFVGCFLSPIVRYNKSNTTKKDA